MIKTNTQNEKYIIESSSERKTKNNKKHKPKNKVTKRKKTLLVPGLPLELKEKNDSFLQKNIGENKTDLKISPDIKQMSQLECARLNEKYIELMETLSDIMLKQGEPFRARAYQKAQETIMAYQGDIKNENYLKGQPGIGPTIMDKLNEYSLTGKLEVIERERNNPVNILADIYGIGPKKAKELVDNGITSIAQLREKQDLVLNDTQKVGLKYYEDVLKRIPRSEIKKYETIFTNVFNKVATPNSHFEIVGSYRRGAESSGDIDMIITSDLPKVFINFIDELISQKIILEVLSRGQTKCLVIAQIPGSDSARRVDFLYTTPEEYPFSVLYFTGSKIFNTVMRRQALSMGLTMNEHGLYTLVNGKKKGEKVNWTFTNEKDIFDYLNMEYKNPEERIDGRSVIIKPKVKSTHKLSIDSDDSEKDTLLLLKKAKNHSVKKKADSQKPKKILIIEDNSDNVVVDTQQNINENISTTTTTTNVKNIINDFKKNGITVLDKLNENQLSAILIESNKFYYNEEPLMTDNEYDIIKDYIESKFPNNNVVKEIGAPVERNKVTLPYKMASMDKIKPDTDALTNWTKKYKGTYVLSCKLDGVSGLYTTEGNVPKLYTRGNGTVGQDISHLIPHLRLPKTKNTVIRGEFIISKSVFDTKYKSIFANPRNMVAGIINHKTINEAIKDINFVAYEVIKPVLKPSQQMEFLGTIDVERVLYKMESHLTNELLSKTLVELRQNYIYEIDGIIVTDDAIYERKSGNPEHAFAFKMVLSDQIAEAKVVDVIWTPSKDGYLKPRVQIEPINLGGVRIEYATGFNGSFINDNKVGIGAIIELIRSGDVIPHIRKVVVPAEQAKMPSVPYKWNNTHIDVLLEDIGSDETVKEKVITGFFRGIGVEGLSSGNIARIIQAGFDTVPDILKMSVNDFLQVEGFKDKTATKLYNGIREKIDSASLITIMSASNIFGRGFNEKKLELIMEAYPNVLLTNETNNQKVMKISSIKGMAGKTAEAFVERIPEFIQFIKQAGLVNKLSQVMVEKKPVDDTHVLFGKTIVMTGFRDASIQDALKNVGAKLGASVSKNTFVVLVKDTDEDTGKANDARKIGVPLMTPEEFKSKYL
jgi:NAD-dependent DNA ligase